MYTFEALGEYVGMLDKSDSKIFDMCWSLLNVWILKSKYPYFFDAQVKKPYLDNSIYRQNFLIHNLENSDEETDKMDDFNPDINLNEEENNFVKMRRAIMYLILKIWSKIEDLNPILSWILEKGKKIIEDSNELPNEEINYQLEALLDVFLSFLKGVRCISKIDWFMPIFDKIDDFFLSDNMKKIFVGHKSHQLLSNKYLEWVIQLKSAIKDENFWRKLCTNAQKFFFKQNILLSNNPRIVNYYLKSYLDFVESSLMYIKEDEWNIMCDRIQINIIPIMTWADENYSNNVFILFDILGILWNK